MICIKTEIPKEICEIDDELKAIYHSHDTVCIWVFKSREDRNNFMNDTVGMKKKPLCLLKTYLKEPSKKSTDH